MDVGKKMESAKIGWKYVRTWEQVDIKAYRQVTLVALQENIDFILFFHFLQSGS